MGRITVAVTRVTMPTQKSADHGDTVQPPFSSAAVFAVLAAPSATPAAHDELVVDMGPRRWRVRHIAEGPLSGQPAGQRDGGRRVSASTSTRSICTRPRRAPASSRRRATELRCDRDTIKAELGQVLLAIEDTQAAAVCPRGFRGCCRMSAAEREDALSLLTAPDLMDQVAGAFVTLGRSG